MCYEASFFKNRWKLPHLLWKNLNYNQTCLCNLRQNIPKVDDKHEMTVPSEWTNWKLSNLASQQGSFFY